MTLGSQVQTATANWPTVRRIDDPEGLVCKFVYERDDAVAESVLYRYPDYATRTVICCSTQSGCPVGCRFCGAGDAFVRNLSAREIIEQVEHSVAATGIPASAMKRLQVMFMSMGEPLLNLPSLLPALYELRTLYPNAALLISTSGPRISAFGMDALMRVASEITTVGLQFSVHESTDAARDLLIPFKAKMTLEEIDAAGHRFFVATGRKPFFNYCAHDGNAGDADADRLFERFDPRFWNATVSVVCERSEGLPATNDHQRALATGFGEKLLTRGFDTRVFDPAGQDTVGGGCGQLWRVQEWFRTHPDQARPSIGAGRPERHAPAALEPA